MVSEFAEFVTIDKGNCVVPAGAFELTSEDDNFVADNPKMTDREI